MGRFNISGAKRAGIFFFYSYVRRRAENYSVYIKPRETTESQKSRGLQYLFFAENVAGCRNQKIEYNQKKKKKLSSLHPPDGPGTFLKYYGLATAAVSLGFSSPPIGANYNPITADSIAHAKDGVKRILNRICQPAQSELILARISKNRSTNNDLCA